MTRFLTRVAPIVAATGLALTGLAAPAQADTLSATVNSTYWGWSRSPGSPAYQTPPVTAFASGGTAPYSYSWQFISGSTKITADYPTAATTDFNAYVPVRRIVDWTAVFHAQITDATGAVAYTPDVTVNFSQETGQ